MKLLKQKHKKFKTALIAVFIAGSSFLSYSFADSYFEVSKNLDIFATLFRELNIYYVDDTKPGELIKTGIDAMLSKLDPYTTYIPESDIEDYRFMTTGQYGGIGAVIRNRGDHVVIAEPYEGFPAEKAGLMAGDVILQIDGKPTKGKSTSDISAVLKGEPNTSVELLIKRDSQEEPIEKTVVREEIKIDDVPYYGMLSDKIGYIKLTSFTETASRNVKKAFKELKEEKGMEKLVLDLRGNGGGLLREAVNIVNLFVKKGQVVVETRGKVKDWDRSHKALNSPLDLQIPLTILMDENSASASEIVAGAIQDLDRGVVIGQKSFGKGLVQQTRSLSYNAKLKVTVAKYYIPSGRCIQKIDYSHRDEEGRPDEVADSLKRAFKTLGGRTVYDGAGIYPDITVEETPPSKAAINLISKMIIFDYATKYRFKHPEIAAPEEFSLSDDAYDEFADFTEDQDFEYVTRSEKLLEELVKTAKRERYYEELKKEYHTLEERLANNKKEDLYTFKDEIKQLLENEILSRYYYQNGRIRGSLSSDPEIDKAIEVFTDNGFYSSVLDGSYKAAKVEDEEIEEGRN